MNNIFNIKIVEERPTRPSKATIVGRNRVFDTTREMIAAIKRQKVN